MATIAKLAAFTQQKLIQLRKHLSQLYSLLNFSLLSLRAYYCGRRIRSWFPTHHARMGHGYSGSVPGRQNPIFLQAMGRRAEETSRTNT